MTWLAISAALVEFLKAATLPATKSGQADTSKPMPTGNHNRPALVRSG